MPNPDSTRKTTATQRKTQHDPSSKHVATKPTSFQDAATVQDRIRMWQIQDVVDAVDPDAFSIRSQSRSEVCRTPARSQSPAATIMREKDAQSTPRKRSTKWVQQQNSAWVRQRRSIREDQKKTSNHTPVLTPENKQKTSRRQTQQDSLPTEYVRTESQRTKTLNSSRAEREYRRERRREARARANGGSDVVDAGIRVYMKSQSVLGSECGDDVSVRTKSVHNEEEPDANQRTSQLRFGNDEPISSGQDDHHVDEAQHVQPSKYAQTLGRPPEYHEALDQPKTRKRALLSKTKEMLIGKGDLPPNHTNRLPSIEAWLDEQPHVSDPFIDDEPVMTPLPTDIPKPLKHKSNRKKISTGPTIVEVDDPNKIWDSVNNVAPHEIQKNARSNPRRKASHNEPEISTTKRRLFSFEVCDEESKGHDYVAPPHLYVESQDGLVSSTQRQDGKSSRRGTRHVHEVAKPLVELTPEGGNGGNSIQIDQNISPPKRYSEPPRERVLPVVPNDEGDHLVRLERPSSKLKRKLTTHDDLLSVLSLPRVQKSTRSLRSARKAQQSSPKQVMYEALAAMRAEELQYTRELKTLVDSVTPVLLQSLLSKADAKATAGLFSDGRDDACFTRPVIDMGVSLQRLKQTHQRLPLQEENIESLLTWAFAAHRIYTDYVKCWRLGFQGVVVNLAPLENSQMIEKDVLARDLDGDVTNEQGHKVDVAYLQKRPLVRIKKLSKLFATISDAMPEHEKSMKVADMYAALMETAKQRHSDEQGRLEDEAAANIDTSRARDIRTMAPLAAVEVDKRRKVRARDYFDLSILHSTGQRLDCKIEIVLRDDPQPSGLNGDILICQVEEETKWLLFQPMQLSNVSARRDRSDHDLVLMLKGVAGIGQTWLELLALRAEEKAAVTEWLHMLGSNPLPPKLNHAPSWHLPAEPPALPQQVQEVARMPLNASALANLPSDIDVPIGEPSVVLGRRRHREKQLPQLPEQKVAERLTKLNMGGGLQQRTLPEHYQQNVITSRLPAAKPNRSPTQSTASSSTNGQPIRSQISSKSSDTPLPATSTISDIPCEPPVSQQRYAPQRFSLPSNLHATTSANVYSTRSDTSSRPLSSVVGGSGKFEPASKEAQSKWNFEPLMSGALQSDDRDTVDANEQRSRKSTPPIVADGPKYSPRLRHYSRLKSSSTPLTDSIREQWVTLAGLRKKTRSRSNTPPRQSTSPVPFVDDIPIPKNVRRHDNLPIVDGPAEPLPPPPTAQRATYTIASSPRTSTDSPPYSPRHNQLPQNGINSPLKHQYQQSSSESDTESDSDETDATSDVLEDDYQSELKDEPTPLVRVSQSNRRSSYTPTRPLPSIPSNDTGTLDPSDSASNRTYRQVPPPESFPACKQKRTIAMVCSWSDRGIWEPIQEDECSIVISPGVVQAFSMSAAHSQPVGSPKRDVDDSESASEIVRKPLVEFELTPVVPLRKGTALDITIRSPPTANSTIRTTNNVMFRSRTIQECEKLYQLINWARCNNPTYAQLARARARQQSVSFAPNIPQTRTKSWFSFGSREKTSYRASSRPPTSIADTATTGVSASSAFSALKNFGQNSPFSINRSSVIRKPGVAAPDSLYSSSNTGTGSGSSTPAPSQAGFIPGPDGPNVPQTSAEAANGGGMVNNMKVRLFLRQGQKWEALGQSLLTVLPAATTNADTRPNTPGSSTPPSVTPQRRSQHFRLPSSGHTPHRIHGDGREKRVLITNAKQNDIVLLDETLGESCFEKVMQTGIAVNVWKEDEQVQTHGGVMTGRSRMYMIQFKTSTEASWVFNMCGTYRYGDSGPA